MPNTGVQSQRKHYRMFARARQFVRTLGLKSQAEWRQYCRGEMSWLPPRPEDVPTNPETAYYDLGWVNYADWLGGESTEAPRTDWREFDIARLFVQALGLSDRGDWIDYCSGEMDELPPLPTDIPQDPDSVYAGRGWTGWNDWLGITATSVHSYRPFELARAWVRKLGLKTRAEYHTWCVGSCPDLPGRPDDIPIHPHKVYADCGWRDYHDWLGSYVQTGHSYRAFEEARDYVQGLKLSNHAEWLKLCRGKLPGKALPADIPRHPEVTYKGMGWSGYGDWLGTGTVIFVHKYRSFDEARNFVRKLGLTGRGQWKEYCWGGLPNKGAKPSDIPTTPEKTYNGQGWAGYRDWLGLPSQAGQGHTYRAFEEARKFARGLRLTNHHRWLEYCRGHLRGMPPRPEDIPISPNVVYHSQGWTGWSDWLGSAKPAEATHQYREFHKARAWVRKLKLKTFAQWREFCRGNIRGLPRKPADIPASPRQVYDAGQWISWDDWLHAPIVPEEVPPEKRRGMLGRVKGWLGSPGERAESKPEATPPAPTRSVRGDAGLFSSLKARQARDEKGLLKRAGRLLGRVVPGRKKP